MRYVPALTIACLTLASPAVAIDFRIETKVFDAQNDDAPIGENLTLFQAGVVYDFLAEPKTVTIFSPPAGSEPGRFIVLDPVRSVKMEITTDQIDGLLAKLRQWATEQEDPYLRFLSQPNFIEEASPDGETLTLSSEHMTYRVRAIKPAHRSALAEYRQFSDWYARFNSRGGMLPFPRLAVNEALDRRNRVPTEVVLTIPAQKLELRSEHRVDWLLSKQDRKLIDEARKQTVSFLRVGPDEFLRSPNGQVADTAVSE